ncbi:hypothetical protein ONZ45_g10204 [Pleurotus djamor]|nr:hypothetical protein ONZ45_g10204 [Pleurotus djamor]
MPPSTRTNRSKRKAEPDPVDDDIDLVDDDFEDMVIDSPAKTSQKSKKVAKAAADDDVFVVNLDEELPVVATPKSSPRKKRTTIAPSSTQATPSRSPVKRDPSPSWDEDLLEESPVKKSRTRKLSSAAKAVLEESASPDASVLRSIHMPTQGIKGIEEDDDLASVAGTVGEDDPGLEVEDEDVVAVPPPPRSQAKKTPSRVPTDPLSDEDVLVVTPPPKSQSKKTTSMAPVVPSKPVTVSRVKPEPVKPDYEKSSSSSSVSDMFPKGWRDKYLHLGFPCELQVMEGPLRRMVTSGAADARLPLTFPPRAITQHEIRRACLFDILPMVPNNHELLNVIRALSFENRGVFVNPSLAHPSTVKVNCKTSTASSSRFMSIHAADPAVGYGKFAVFVSTVALSSVHFHSALLPTNWSRPARTALATFFDEELPRIGGFFGGVFAEKKISALPITYIDGFLSFQTLLESTSPRQAYSSSSVAPPITSPRKNALFKKSIPVRLEKDPNPTRRAFPDSLGYEEEVPVYDLRRLPAPIDFNTDEGWSALFSCPRLQLGSGTDELGFEDDPAIALLGYTLGTYQTKSQSTDDDNGCLNILFVAILSRASSSENGIPTAAIVSRLEKLSETVPSQLGSSALRVVDGKLALRRIS